MPDVATNLCANADVLSWFADLKLSDQISVIGIIVSIITSIISFALGVISLILSHRYKKQADEFADLQFMPDFYLFKENKICTKLNAAVKCDGTIVGQIPFICCAEESPIYKLNIKSLSVDGKYIGDKPCYNSIDIYPTDPYFKVDVLVPDELRIDNRSHAAEIVLSYESKYCVTYIKKISFDFTGGLPQNIRLYKPERIKHG